MHFPAIYSWPEQTLPSSPRRPMSSKPENIETSEDVCCSGIHDWALKIERAVDLISSAVREMVRNTGPVKWYFKINY